MTEIQEQTHKEETIQSAFLTFHYNNPQVYDLFKKFAYEARDAGFRHIGAKAIAERIRWQTMLETHGGGWKVNNNYVSRYVRMLLDECPFFRGFFETRGLKTS